MGASSPIRPTRGPASAPIFPHADDAHPPARPYDGVVAEQLFVIIHHRGPAWADGVPYLQQPALGGHIGFMSSLEERGLMVLGGPYADSDADPTGIVGMAIVRAASQAEAEALAAEDPTVATGMIEPRVRPWRAVMGSAVG